MSSRQKPNTTKSKKMTTTTTLPELIASVQEHINNGIQSLQKASNLIEEIAEVYCTTITTTATTTQNNDRNAQNNNTKVKNKKPPYDVVLQFSVITDAAVASYPSIRAAARALVEETGGNESTVRKNIHRSLRLQKNNNEYRESSSYYSGYYYRYMDSYNVDSCNDESLGQTEEENNDDEEEAQLFMPSRNGSIAVVKCSCDCGGCGKNHNGDDDDDDDGNGTTTINNNETTMTTTSTKELARFESITAAAKELKETNPSIRDKNFDRIRQAIGRVLRKERECYAGFTYRYAAGGAACYNDNEPSPLLATAVAATTNNVTTATTPTPTTKLVVQQLCATTKQEIARFPSAAAAARALAETDHSTSQDMLRKHIGRILRGEKDSYGGFVYCYASSSSLLEKEPTTTESSSSKNKRKASSDLSTQQSVVRPEKKKITIVDTTTNTPPFAAEAAAAEDSTNTTTNFVPPDLEDAILLGSLALPSRGKLSPSMSTQHTSS